MRQPSGHRGTTSKLARGLVWGFLLTGGVLFALPESAASQVEEQLNQDELEFESALRDHESALAARAVVESRFSRWAQAADQARRQGDDDAMEEAFAQAQTQLVELRRLDRRVEQTEERLGQARGGYLETLGLRLDGLLEEARTATPQERGAILFLVEDLNNRVSEVEADLDLAGDLGSVVMPEVDFDPRDGPLEMRAKAELLERAAERYDSLVVEVDERVVGLEQRVRRDQALRDFREGIDRFGDTQLPVRPPTTRPSGTDLDQVAQADSTGVATQLSPEERIELLLFFRSELLTTREQLILRARLFRERAGGVLA